MIASRERVLILNGPMGTELGRRGAALPDGTWSAHALEQNPALVAEIHRDYAAAGATIHTTNTFRTKRRSVGAGWQDLTRQAVRLARENAGPTIAGCISPLMDCYSPWLSPPEPREEHREMAAALANSGVDILLVETFPHVGEAIIAVEEAVATGKETWVSFTAGPDDDLLSARQIGAGAHEAVRRGAAAVLVNCVPARATHFHLQRLSEAGAPFGAYANAGPASDGLGWEHAGPDAAQRYADLAEEWVKLGATIVGGCCGTGVGHIRELVRRFG